MEEKFKELYFTHFKALVKFAYFYCKDKDEAGSTVQQVFLEVWEKRESLLNQTSLKSYLFTAVRNRTFNAIRRTQIVEELDEKIENPEIDAHDKMEIAELQNRIDSAIQTLPDRCRYVFELSRFEQMTYSEIAKHLDLSVKTVENQIGKALKILRNKIYNNDNQ